MRRLSAIVGMFFAALAVDVALAETTDRIGRATRVEGDVGLRSDYAADPARIARGWPIVRGSIVTTGENGRAEILVGSAVIRIDRRSELEITELDSQRIHLRVLDGSVIVRADERIAADGLEVSTPQQFSPITEPGYYRFDTRQRAEGQRDEFDDWSLALDRREGELPDERYALPDASGYGPAWVPPPAYVYGPAYVPAPIYVVPPRYYARPLYRPAVPHIVHGPPLRHHHHHRHQHQHQHQHRDHRHHDAQPSLPHPVVPGPIVRPLDGGARHWQRAQPVVPVQPAVPRVEHRRFDGQRIEHRRFDGQRIEHRRFDDQRIEHRRFDGPRVEHRHFDAPRFDRPPMHAPGGQSGRADSHRGGGGHASHGGRGHQGGRR